MMSGKRKHVRVKIKNKTAHDVRVRKTCHGNKKKKKKKAVMSG